MAAVPVAPAAALPARPAARLAQAYDRAEAITREHSQSFYLATALLPGA